MSVCLTLHAKVIHMQRVSVSILICAMALCLLGWAAPARGQDKATKFDFKDGDRVVFIGNTFIEREQQHGYIETALTITHPDKHITFRNLGWSGDNVWGESRARFGNVQEGFRHLIDNAKVLKPTVLIVSYGHNAAFEGEKGLDKFIKGYERLLDTLQKEVLQKDGRVVLITPHKQEKLGPPLPDPSEYNQYVTQYVSAIEKLAKQRGFSCWKLEPIRHHFTLVGDREVRFPLTDNGMHFLPFGYWRVAHTLVGVAGHRAAWSSVEFENGKFAIARGVKVTDVKAASDRLSFTLHPGTLPLPRFIYSTPPGFEPKAGPAPFAMDGTIVQASGMKVGKYEVRHNGDVISKFDWSPQTPDHIISKRLYEQVEKLRKTIVEKNELFFHRYRPANETYLFLFRKHEQGNNAKEMPMFDPLIEAKEKEIAKLRKPGVHKYEIVRVGDAK